MDDPTRPIRWSILGCGDVAEKKGGPALYKADGSRLVAVMRRDREKAEDFARRHGAAQNGPPVRAYDDADALLADPEVDAVYVATPPHLHEAQTVAAARAGKHVLVEKPMALDGAACGRMIAACRDAGVRLHVAYYRRFYPKFVAAREMLAAGAVGRILGGRLLLCAHNPGGGWRVDPAVSGGGHVVDVGSHRIDTLLHLLGAAGEPVDPVAAAGWAENLMGAHAAENDVALALRTAGGAVASASFHFQTRPAGRDVLEIYGDAGTLAFDLFDGPAFTLRRQGDEETFTFTTPDPVHLPFVAALVDVYRGADRPHVSGEEGARTTRVLDAALSSFRYRDGGGASDVAAK